MNLKACGPRVGFWRPIFQVQGWAFSMSSLQLLVCTTLVVWVSLPTSQEGVPRPSKYQQNTGKRIKIMGWNTILCVLGGSSYTYIYIYTCIDTYKVYYTYTYIYTYYVYTYMCICIHKCIAQRRCKGPHLQTISADIVPAAPGLFPQCVERFSNLHPTNHEHGSFNDIVSLL